MSHDLLAAITAGAATAARERARTRRHEVERAAADREPRGEVFRARLAAPGYAVIAECKRRSPSKGILRVDYDPATIAEGYARAGAAAISVLTEPTFFDGALEHLTAVRARVETPVLRKDFISEEFQLVEARAAGADAVLLIVAALAEQVLVDLHQQALALGLAALVEVHDADELRQALDAGATIVGVNCRNLKTLEVDLRLHSSLVLGIPAGVVAVAESGLRTAADLQRLKHDGYDAFLIGERFMSEPDPGDALAALRREATR